MQSIILGELVEDLDDMDLEGDGAESGNDEAMGPPRDDATATFDKHKGENFIAILLD